MTAAANSSAAFNILLVEDSEPDTLIARRAFKNAKQKTGLFVVSHGQECLDFVRHEGLYRDKDRYPRPDLILLDINMPRMDGFEVLKAVKTDGNYNSIPIIVFTGSNNREDVMKSYALGANSFIQKPVTYEEFVELLDVFNTYWQVINKLPGRD